MSCWPAENLLKHDASNESEACFDQHGAQLTANPVPGFGEGISSPAWAMHLKASTLVMKTRGTLVNGTAVTSGECVG